MPIGSKLRLLNFEIFCSTPVNYDPVSEDLIVIRVYSDPGQRGGGAGQARYEQPMRIQRLGSPSHTNPPNRTSKKITWTH